MVFIAILSAVFIFSILILIKKWWRDYDLIFMISSLLSGIILLCVLAIMSNTRIECNDTIVVRKALEESFVEARKQNFIESAGIYSKIIDFNTDLAVRQRRASLWYNRYLYNDEFMELKPIK